MTAIGMDLTLRARSLLVVNQRRDVAKRAITCCGSKISWGESNGKRDRALTKHDFSPTGEILLMLSFLRLLNFFQ